jgi:hypothetical protein
LSFQLESLNFLPSLQHSHGGWMDPMWKDCYNKLLVILDKLLAKILIYLMGTEYQEFELSFCAPQANEHGHSTIVQNLESLKISQALNSFNFE